MYKTTAEHNELAQMLSGQDIHTYLACGGTLESLIEIKHDFANWADATAEFQTDYIEENHNRATGDQLFVNNPY